MMPVDPVHWADLSALNPEEAASRCQCQWDPRRGYGVPFLGRVYWVHPFQRTVYAHEDGTPLEPHLPLVLVHYLLKTQDRPLQGKMVTEREVPGGAFFFRHLHKLPVQPLEEAFGRWPEAFLKAGRLLGGRPKEVSPASFEILPFSRVPVGFHLWPADEEFPARCVITFDSSVHLHLPLDIIWALTQVLVQRLMGSKP